MQSLNCMMKFIRNLIRSDNKVVTRQKPGLILHIGIEKTGTTTIQEFLHLNRKLLTKNGFYFPKSIGMRNHRPLVACFTKNEKENNFTKLKNITNEAEKIIWKKNTLKTFVNEMNSLPAGIVTVLISSEHFSTKILNEDELIELKNNLEQIFSEIKIIVYLRRQDLLAVSRYSTVLKSGFTEQKIFRSSSPNSRIFNFKLLLDRWKNIFGEENIHPAIFEKKEWKSNDLLSDFRNRCRLPENLNYLIPMCQNQSYSETTQEIALLFNALIRNNLTGNDLKTVNKIRHDLLEAINKKYPGPGKIPLRHEAIEFYNSFREYNDQVAREWFSREKLFNEDFSMYPETNSATRQIPDYDQILHEEIKEKMDDLKPFLMKDAGNE